MVARDGGGEYIDELIKRYIKFPLCEMRNSVLEIFCHDF